VSSGCVWRNGLQIRRVARNVLNKQSRAADRRGPPPWGLGEVVTLHRNKGEVTGEWRRLHNEELYGLYCSPNIIRMLKSRKIRWTGHVARIGKMREAYRILVRET
jgi:hypothetical protein